MPKYYEFKVCGYYLYYTASCVIEAMHVHASDRKLNEREIKKIRAFIKSHYKEMYLKWREIADTGFYGEKKC